MNQTLIKEQQDAERPKRKNLLPPCRVCGFPAAGFHYGVNTCEACKGFFHRSLNLHQHFVCKQNETCGGSRGNRRMCRKCRYARCVAAGMAKEAIKTGRYTTIKHTTDTLEVQRLKQRDVSQRGSISDESAWKYEANTNTTLESGNSYCGQAACSSSASSLNDNDQLSPDAKNEICCDASGLSSRCLDNLQSCSSYRRLNEKSDADSVFMLRCIDFLSNHKECINSSSKTCKKKRHAHGSKTPGSLIENSISTTASSSVTSITKSTQTDVELLQQETLIKTSHLPISPNSLPQTPPELCSLVQASEAANLSPSFQSLSLPTDLGNILSSEKDISDPSSLSLVHSCNPSQDSSDASNIPLHAQSSLHQVSSDVSTIENLYTDKDQIVRILIEAHDKYLEPNINRIPEDEIDRMAAEHLEFCKMKADVFGDIKRLPDAEYDFIYASTGVDVDNRQERYENWFQSIEMLARSTVKFTKAIPGFSLLSTREMINLIKSALTDVAYINNYRNSRPELGVIYGPDRRLRCVLDCPLISDPYDHVVDLLDSQIKFCRALKTLGLNREEEAVLKAIVIMSPDRGTPSATARAIYEQLNNSLIYLLNKNRAGNTMLLYAKVVNSMVLAQTASYKHAVFVRKLNLSKYSRIEQKPLIFEILGSNLYNEEEETEFLDDENIATVHTTSAHCSSHTCCERDKLGVESWL